MKKLSKKEKNQNKILKSIKKIFKKIFLINSPSPNQSLKSQIFNMVYYEIVGAILCLIVLFILSGGKNYFKLYRELENFIDTYDAITREYYTKVEKKELVNEAIHSMLESIDDNYTNYNLKKETEEFFENVEGTYEGIGASVTTNENGKIIIASVFENTPASKAGLKEKDIIIKIDGKDYTEKTSNDAANYIKTTQKAKIKLTILRDKKEKEITITRDKIEVPSITSEIFQKDDKKIGYLKISIFSSVATEQLKQKLEKLEKEKIDSLIIDVRNNSGGYLSTATDIASLFLKKGSVIYQLESSKQKTKIKDTTKEKRTYPIAVLINKSSASASEILASAIKESYKGHIIGVNSYGKGTVQKTKQLKDGSMIKYTIQKWLTPKGNWINEKGVTPTDYIEIDSNSEQDTQLEKAKEILLKDLLNN